MSRFNVGDRVIATWDTTAASEGQRGTVKATDYDTEDGLELLIHWDNSTYSDWTASYKVKLVPSAPLRLELTDGRSTSSAVGVNLLVEPSILTDGVFVKVANDRTHNVATIHLDKESTDKLAATLQAFFLVTPAKPWEGLTAEEAYNKGREDAS